MTVRAILKMGDPRLLRIAKIVQETPDARSFVFEIPSDLADKFRYRAGQFLTFRVPLADGGFNRCYSLSSAPEADGLPKVTVKRVTGGNTDEHLARMTIRASAGVRLKKAR